MKLKHKIGTKVNTAHGNGVVIGYDLPESQNLTRYIVKLDDTKRFNFNPCYIENEVEILPNDPTTAME